MNITNLKGLPDAIVRAVTNDPYNPGKGHISVTKLIDAPQRRALYAKYKNSIVEDVSDRIWSLLGQSVHTILERAHKESAVKVEERLYTEVNGWTVSGQFDRLDLHGTTLDDYKVTSVWNSSGNVEWERQLNLLRCLAWRNGYEVDTLRVIAIFRDWKKGDAERKPDYPQAAVGVIQIPVWSIQECNDYLNERVRLHQRAVDGDVIPCTDEERWHEPSKFALLKKGGKRAIRIYETRDEIGPIPDGTFVEERKGSYRRCEQYCEVAPFCTQWAEQRGPVSDAEGEAGPDY